MTGSPGVPPCRPPGGTGRGVTRRTRRSLRPRRRRGSGWNAQAGRTAACQTCVTSFRKACRNAQPEKRAMGRAAAELVKDGMTVYLDAGTTILSMVSFLFPREGLTVVTNDFTTVEELQAARHLSVIHTGGQVEPDNRSSVGRLAAATVRQLAFDLAFISTGSWDLIRGVSTPTAAKVEIKQAAMEAASRSVLVAGSSKCGSFGMYRVAPLTAFDMVITDAALTEAAAEGIRAGGTDLHLARI
ncbi:DeoR/GlpR family DNA-binding transcription regulator [Nonomuraea sp. NPDC052129]|uniref:DeoR/GlpR family DNA-binding transcription regulator n=1 Tax=Nonomuraea sp. NPDC052129 TaxID=3154651 RepID=UPI00341BAF09